MLEKTLVVGQRISYVRQEEELGNHHVEGDFHGPGNRYLGWAVGVEC